jgi:hypothetical protein
MCLSVEEEYSAICIHPSFSIQDPSFHSTEPALGFGFFSTMFTNCHQCKHVLSLQSEKTEGLLTGVLHTAF